MLETLKTAGKIWISAFRFVTRSPGLIVLTYAFLFLIEFAADAIGDLTLDDWVHYGDALSWIILPAILVSEVAIGCFLHVYGMRYAMRYATGSVDAWSPMKWCKRCFDFALGMALYLGLSFGVVPIVVETFMRLQRTWNEARVSERLGYNPLFEDSSRMGGAEYAASLLAIVLLALLVLYVLCRLSLWLPMAAFRRDDQWSLVLAWHNSKSRGLLLMSTLVLFEVVFGALFIFSLDLPAFKTTATDWIAKSGLYGGMKLGDELAFLFDLVGRMLMPAIICLVFAVRTSVAANILGIREPGANEAYFTYKSRALPTRSPLS